MSLARINNQIANLQTSIYSLNQQAYQKSEELERLKRALNELTDYKVEFQRFKILCVQPELSANTWSGTTANRFEGLRKDRIVTSYEAIVDNDLSQILDRVREKIETTRQSIGSLQRSMSTQNSTLNQLYAQRRKELMS